LFQIASKQTGIPHSLEIKGDGSAAIDYLSSLPPKDKTKASDEPNLILLDIKMPKTDGLEVLAWIRKQARFATLPVIMFTSSANPEDVLKAMALGANSFVVKTGDMLQLKQMVQALMQFWFGVHHQA
jgi:CheY-like chemotaxis protein